jgi:hypothetical protein
VCKTAKAFLVASRAQRASGRLTKSWYSVIAARNANGTAAKRRAGAKAALAVELRRIARLLRFIVHFSQVAISNIKNGVRVKAA